MKKLFLLVVLIMPTWVQAQVRVSRLTLTNPAACAFVKEVLISDIGSDGSTDVIQYFMQAERQSVYFYRGSALWRLWKDEPRMYLPPDTVLGPAAAPADTELGLVQLKGPAISFLAIPSPQMRKLFAESDQMLKLRDADGSLSTETIVANKAWIDARFTDDVRPERICMATCSCGQVAE